MKFGTESETLEFKESTSELHQAVESIAAILNKHESGKIYFGIDDAGNIKGQVSQTAPLKRYPTPYCVTSSLELSRRSKKRNRTARPS